MDSVSCLLRKDATCFGARCSGYKQTKDGITLAFDNRPDETFDVVIACDGVKSKMRRCLYEQKGLDVEKQVARYSKWVVWRGELRLYTVEPAGIDIDQVFCQSRHSRMRWERRPKERSCFAVKIGQFVR